MERKNRVEILQRQMLDRDILAVLVEDRRNREYLTYADVWEGSMIITQKEAVLLVDFRYYEMAMSAVKDCQVRLCQNLDDGIRQVTGQLGIRSIGIEKSRVPYGRYRKLLQALEPCCLNEDVCVDEIIKQNRRYKDDYELSCLRTAQEITDRAYEYILTKVHAGMMESEIRMELGCYMIRQGSESFDIGYISSSGKKTSLPHGGTGDKAVEKGDLIMIDFGAVIGGYHSDCTRTFAVGSVTERQREVYEIVCMAQQKALDGIRPGMTGIEVDRIARNYINDCGFEGCFDHGLGHSIGLEGHENPRFNEICGDIIEPGIVMTVEPGIYLEHDFGVRIEDMGVVTDIGFENFTKASRELMIVGS